MSDRISEPRWQFRFLVLDLLVMIAERVGVDAIRVRAVRNMIDSLRGMVERDNA